MEEMRALDKSNSIKLGRFASVFGPRAPSGLEDRFRCLHQRVHDTHEAVDTVWTHRVYRSTLAG